MPTACDLNQDLPGAHLGLGDFFQLQDFGPAKFVHTDGLHGINPRGAEWLPPYRGYPA